jgi:hypothetical protein
MIELPSRAVHDYLLQFGVAAVFITSTGKIGVARNLSRACPIVSAWWVQDRATAEQILVAVGEHPPSSVDGATRAVRAAAERLGVGLSEHATVMARAKAATAKLDARLKAAQNDGLLSTFNSEFRRRRLAARSAGKRFMPYAVAQRRLRRLLAAAAAGAPMPELMRAVFEG